MSMRHTLLLVVLALTLAHVLAHVEAGCTTGIMDFLVCDAHEPRWGP